MTSSTRRRPVIITHRARPATEERKDDMDSYKTQILAMLDTVTDIKVMRLIHDVIRAILMNR